VSDLQNIFGQGFDTGSVEPQADFEVIPPGDVPVLIEKAEVKQTKANTGYYIALTLDVIDGPHKGRKLFDNINIANQNKQCEEIGRRTLAALGQSIGVPFIQDCSQLINRACIAAVKVKDGDNQIRTYKPMGGVPAQPAYNTAVASQGAVMPTTQYQPPQQPQQQYAAPQQPQQAYQPPTQPQYHPPMQQQPQYAAPAAPTGQPTPPWVRR
jgi:hypothetical protein